MNAEQFFTESLARVESASIRAWAQTDRNRPLWLEICEHALANGKYDTDLMAAYIVCVAIGA